MKQIETLSSLEGRKLLWGIYQELRFEKQLSSLSTLLLLWRITTNEREIFKYVNQEVTVIHPLGIFGGTSLWMEEVVNRFYFSTINSFVYLGAAILLMLVGMRRFTENFNDTYVIVGVAFESLMLIFMFVVMLFSPPDEGTQVPGQNGNSDNENSVTDLIIEVGEIATDFATVVVNLENLSESLKEILYSQNQLISSVNKLAESNAMAVSPNPQLLETMKNTNDALQEFKNSVNNLNIAAEALKREEIEIAVRKEVERILVNKINRNNEL
jgi:hypothetical protein